MTEDSKITPLEKKNLLQLIRDVEELVHVIHDSVENKLPNSIRKPLFGISHFKMLLANEMARAIPDDNAIVLAISEMIIRANNLRISVEGFPDDLSPRDSLFKLSFIIKRFAQNSTLVEYAGHSRAEQRTDRENQISKLSAGIEILSTQLAALQSESNRSRKYILESQQLAEDTSSRLSNFDELLSETFVSSSARVDQVLAGLADKQREVNELVGAVAGSAMAGSYSVSAESERRLADWMRAGSVLLMLIISCLVGYSLLDTSQPNFDWQIALFRLLFSLALSVPAAYMARESARHREQQYAFLSISLDLKSITPFLASLPFDDQNKLKVDIANRIFGKVASPAKGESYPLNIQELILEILKKVEMPKPKNGGN